MKKNGLLLFLLSFLLFHTCLLADEAKEDTTICDRIWLLCEGQCSKIYDKELADADSIYQNCAGSEWNCKVMYEHNKKEAENNLIDCLTHCQGLYDNCYLGIVIGGKMGTKFPGEDFEMSPPYPNPATYKINIPISMAQTSSVSISIRTIIGQEVYRHVKVHEVGETSKSIDISSWDEGTYIYNIETNGTAQQGKFTIVR